MSLALPGLSNLVGRLGLTAGDVALLLLLAGILLIYAEFNRPGTVLLGALGALFFMLGVDELLPLQFAAEFAALTLAGVLILLLAIRFPLRSLHGAGAVAGAVALVFGLRNLIVQPNSAHWIIALFTGAIFAVVTYVLGRIAVLAARNKRLPSVRFPASNLKPHPANSGKPGSTG